MIIPSRLFVRWDEKNFYFSYSPNISSSTISAFFVIIAKLF